MARPKSNRPGKRAVNAQIKAELVAAMHLMAENHRPQTDKTAIITEALEAYLHAYGYWPTPDSITLFLEPSLHEAFRQYLKKNSITSSGPEAFSLAIRRFLESEQKG